MTGIDLSRRSDACEIMDDARIGFEEFHQALRELGQINRLSLGYRPTLTWLAQCLRHHGNPPTLSILDVGFGYGDMLRQLRGWTARRGIAAELHGVDLSPWAKRAALAHSPPHWPIRYHTADIFTFRMDKEPDIVINALFAHHLSDDALIRFLHWMEAHARLGWFVNDLHRSAAAYHGVKLFQRVMGYSPMVRHDGPVSVARARTIGEWRAILAEADIDPASVHIRRYAPFRIGIGCCR